jgi:hypothetical protein
MLHETDQTMLPQNISINVIPKHLNLGYPKTSQFMLPQNISINVTPKHLNLIYS